LPANALPQKDGRVDETALAPVGRVAVATGTTTSLTLDLTAGAYALVMQPASHRDHRSLQQRHVHQLRVCAPAARRSATRHRLPLATAAPAAAAAAPAQATPAATAAATTPAAPEDWLRGPARERCGVGRPARADARDRRTRWRGGRMIAGRAR
jgi:hypothetical protein